MWHSILVTMCVEVFNAFFSPSAFGKTKSQKLRFFTCAVDFLSEKAMLDALSFFSEVDSINVS